MDTEKEKLPGGLTREKRQQTQASETTQSCERKPFVCRMRWTSDSSRHRRLKAEPDCVLVAACLQVCDPNPQFYMVPAQLAQQTDLARSYLVAKRGSYSSTCCTKQKVAISRVDKPAEQPAGGSKEPHIQHLRRRGWRLQLWCNEPFKLLRDAEKLSIAHMFQVRRGRERWPDALHKFRLRFLISEDF